MRARWRVAALAAALLGALLAVPVLVVAPGLRLTGAVALWSVPLLLGIGCGALLLALGAGSSRRRRAAEAAAARGRDEERERHRRFLARLDHELKNPVTAIRAAVAAADVDSPHLRVADAQADRLASLLGDLRKLADLETQPIELEPVDLEAVCREAVADIESAPGASGSSRRIDATFPRVPWPLPPVRGDMDLLYLAVHNLLGNAVKYSPGGGPIEVRGTDEGGWVVIEVADTGMGIPEPEQAAVLDDLARGSEARGIPGSGIGLALVRIIAERHGGSVQLRSRHREGTVVRLRLPAVR